MTRNKDFFVNTKRDKSFFIKEPSKEEIISLDTHTSPQVNQAAPKSIKDLVVADYSTIKRVSTSLEDKPKLEDQIRQKESEYAKANNYSDFSKRNEAKTQIGQDLSKLREQLNIANKNLDLKEPTNMMSAEQVANNDANAPFLQKTDKFIKSDLPEIAKKTGRTAMDLAGNVLTGSASAIEGMADVAVGNVGALGGAITSLSGLAPNKLSKAIEEGATKFVKTDYSGSNLLEEGRKKGVYEPKVLGVKVSDALKTIANMVTSAGVGGTAGFVGSAAGQGIQEALLDNQNLDRAVVYGDIAGTIEGLTEKMFDAVNLLGGGKFDKFLPKSAVGKLIGGSVGEGIEEFVSDGVNPLVKWLIYEKGTYDMPTLMEYLGNLKEATWNGFVIGLIMKGGQDVSTPEIRNQYKDEVSAAVNKSKLPEELKDTVKNALITPIQAQKNFDLDKMRNSANYQANQNPYNTISITPESFKKRANLINEIQNNQNSKLALPSPKIFVDEKGTAMTSEQEYNSTKEAFKKRENLINEINNTSLSEPEKADLIDTLSNTDLTPETEQDIKNILGIINNPDVETANSLQNISSNFKDNKSKYAQYSKGSENYDSQYTEKAKNEIRTRDGRRTKEQWLDVARKIGDQIYNMSDADIEKYAYQSWINTRPNQKGSLNRQGKGFVSFTIDNWVNKIYNTVRENRENNKVDQKTEVKLPNQQEMMSKLPNSTSPAQNTRKILAEPTNDLLKSVRNGYSEQSRVSNRAEVKNQPKQVYETINSVKALGATNNQIQTILKRHNAERVSEIVETVRSAKLSGMKDVDIERAEKLNDALNSGAKLKFYDPQNIPGEITNPAEREKAGIANGFYSNGTIWINKNSPKVAETILGHELTHHLESTKTYTDFANTVLDSDMYYDWLRTKGYRNSVEYKNDLLNNYSEDEVNYEMVANFVEEKLFGDQETINRLAQQNPTWIEKIKSWLDDMAVKFMGTAEEKELRNIQNMYKKALNSARNTDVKSGTQYSIAGTKAMDNINDSELKDSYNEAVSMNKTGAYKGWFKDKNGDWKFEFTDKDMKIKDDIKILKDKTYKLGDVLEHDILFRAYPELQNYNVEFTKLRDTIDGNFIGLTNTIQIDPDKLKSKADAEGTMIHEIQHAIQKIEGFERGASSKNSKLEYYTSLGEIEAADTRDRLERERAKLLDRRLESPESSKENPQHKGLKDYLANRTEKDIKRDNKFLREKELKGKIKDGVQKFFGLEGGKNEEEVAGLQNNKLPTQEAEQAIGLDRNVRGLADKQSAFSMPENRYSINPVNIANNPPNMVTGLNAIQRKARQTEGDSKSKFADSVQHSDIFNDDIKRMAKNNININTYDRISNKETLNKANDNINENGQKEVNKLLSKSSKDFTAEDVAESILLMDRYQQVGDYESTIAMMEKLRKAGTRGGQTIQMFSALGRLTPEGMTYYAQKELSKAFDTIMENKTQAWADEHRDEFKLTDRDIEYIQRRVTQSAKLPEGRDKHVLLGEIASRIQDKIPPTEGQSLKALARNSMLLNPKTMVRNILGNAIIAPAHIASDFIGSGIDKAISNKTGVRTTGGFDVKSLEGAKKGFYESFDDFRRKISTRDMNGDRFEIGQGKNFNENNKGKFSTPLNAMGRALNGLDRVTGYLLESGDRPFYETWFINSLNNQMKLNNASSPTAEMIEIATDEALQRTWQDNNAYTKAVSGLRKSMNSFNIKGYGLGDMVMPFIKTPANLTKAVIDFSPLGAINAALKTGEFNKNLSKGTATSKQQRAVVKAWSQVITGSLGMAVMAALANTGVLSGGADDDKDVKSFEQNILGIKPYSIRIGDSSYTYDWAQPLGTSVAMVTDTVKSLKNATDNESKVGALLKGAQSGASVLLDQSFVSGIRNLFEEDNLINALIETGLNEPAKFTPQVLSQIAQIQDDTARTSYVYNNIPNTALNKVKAKIPGLRQTLEPTVDVLGREVKTNNSVGNVMFNPANTAFARNTKAAEEMYKVYKSTGDKSTIAQVAPYYFNVGKEKIVLTPYQKTQYQKTMGKIASDGVENLININAYNSLEDVDKAEILKDLYSYGTSIAKSQASSKYEMPKDQAKIRDSGMKPEEYILLKYISSSGGTKKDEMYSALVSAGYGKSKAEDFLTDYKGYKFDATNSKLPTLKDKLNKLPKLKK